MAPKEIDRATRDRIAGWLRVQWRKRALTQAELADKLHTTEGTISRILHGKRDAGIEIAVKMHRYLAMSLDQMFDEEPRPAALAAPLRDDEDARIKNRGHLALAVPTEAAQDEEAVPSPQATNVAAMVDALSQKTSRLELAKFVSKKAAELRRAEEAQAKKSGA